MAKRKKPVKAGKKAAVRKPDIRQTSKKQAVAAKPSAAGKKQEENFQLVFFWFLIGIAFMIIGISADLPALFTAGIALFVLGIAKKYSWPRKKQK